MGRSMTIADIYAYIVLSWTPFVGLSLEPYPNLIAFYDRMKAIPVIQDAHARIASDSLTTHDGKTISCFTCCEGSALA